jgi:hypothetical protein
MRVIGHWSLVIGHWSLVIGHWSLVIGHWRTITQIGEASKNHGLVNGFAVQKPANDQ